MNRLERALLSAEEAGTSSHLSYSYPDDTANTSTDNRYNNLMDRVRTFLFSSDDGKSGRPQFAM